MIDSGARTKIAMVSLDWDLVDLIEQSPNFELVGIFDRAESATLRGLRWLGSDEDWRSVQDQYPELKIILAIDPPHLRQILFAKYGIDSVASIISQDAYISRHATIGRGVMIQRGVKVMPHASLGIACKIHINATIHHESRIGDFCTISPGAQILGNVEIGDGTYVGAGAIIRQRIKIGSGVKIGAGAVVVKDIPNGHSVVGVPADRLLSKKP